MAHQPALAGITTAERTPGRAVRDRAALEGSVRVLASDYHHHLAGTSRMGDDARDAVVALDLSLHRLRGRSIGDAAVVPVLVNGNAHAPVT